MTSNRSPASLTLLSFRADSVGDVIGEHTGGRFFDELTLGQLGSMRRHYAIGAGLFLAAGIALGVSRLGRGTLSSAFADLARAQPGWIVAAASFFALSLLASVAGWRVGLRACGGSTCFTQTSARYMIGSLVNSLAPAHLGGAVRLGLLSRTLPGEDRLWRAAGIAASVAAGRGLVLAALIVPAAVVGRLPLWPAPLLVLAVVVVLVLGTRFSARTAGRLGSLLQIFRSIGRAPRKGAALFGWIGCSLRVSGGRDVRGTDHGTGRSCRSRGSGDPDASLVDGRRRNCGRAGRNGARRRLDRLLSFTTALP